MKLPPLRTSMFLSCLKPRCELYLIHPQVFSILYLQQQGRFACGITHEKIRCIASYLTILCIPDGKRLLDVLCNIRVKLQQTAGVPFKRRFCVDGASVFLRWLDSAERISTYPNFSDWLHFLFVLTYTSIFTFFVTELLLGSIFSGAKEPDSIIPALSLRSVLLSAPRLCQKNQYPFCLLGPLVIRRCCTCIEYAAST